jgi:hypothetical protein
MPDEPCQAGPLVATTCAPGDRKSREQSNGVAADDDEYSRRPSHLSGTVAPCRSPLTPERHDECYRDEELKQRATEEGEDFAAEGKDQMAGLVDREIEAVRQR